jgi:hypothetical protein
MGVKGDGIFVPGGIVNALPWSFCSAVGTAAFCFPGEEGLRVSFQHYFVRFSEQYWPIPTGRRELVYRWVIGRGRENPMQIGAGTILAGLAIAFPVAIKGIMVLENRIAARRSKIAHGPPSAPRSNDTPSGQAGDREPVLTHRV